MAQVNPLTREVLIKLVYYGPGLGGKTTSLQCIHSSSPPETRGQIVSLATPVDRTLYFDFLPLRVPPVRGHHVRLQLFTVPGQVYFNATRKLVLTGADGVMFVADSQRDRHDANLESMANLAWNLEEQGRSLADIPLVLQYNKKDLPNALGVHELDEALNAMGGPAFPTCATSGEGVLEALDALIQRVLEDLEARNAFGEPMRDRPAPQFGRAEEALEEQIGRASEQIWRSTVERAIQQRPAIPTPARTPDVSPWSAGQSSAPSRPHTIPAGNPLVESIAPAGQVRAKWPAGTPVGPTWVALFHGHEEDVHSLEQELMQNRFAEAIAHGETLVLRLLMDASSKFGSSSGAAADPAWLAMWLGIDALRWSSYQRVVRRARERGPVDQRDALNVYALVIDIKLRAELLRI